MPYDCRLYLITPPRIHDLPGFAESLKRALDGGVVACLQLRLKDDKKSVPDRDVLDAAELLAPIAQSRDVAFIINDRPDLALRTGADGVHIGQQDTAFDRARAILGDDASIGVTCHDSRHLALLAGEAGADYVAFGAFFPTSTKIVEHVATPNLLEWWNFATTVPSVAIGGITPENCTRLVRAGANFLAVSSAVWAHPDGPDAAVKAMNAAISAA